MKRKKGGFTVGILTFVLLVLVLTTAAQAVGFPPVRNFTKQNYGAGNQNWAMAQDSYGRVYFGNRDGLLKYDGTRWSLFHLPNYTTVRCVHVQEKTGRIYVGGTGEFGYFHNDPETRTIKYVSLLTTLRQNEQDFAEIWNIHELPDGKMIFQGDFRLIISDGKSSMVVKSNDKITSSALISGTVYVGTQTGGIGKLSGNAIEHIARIEGNDKIISILPYGKKILAATASSGLFSIEGSSIREEIWDISPFLKDNQTFSANTVGELYAFGTVNSGAVVKNIKTGVTSYVSRQTGLLNNTVLGLGFDFSSNLWLCLDNGLGYAMVDSPVYNLFGDSSDAGAGYSSIRTDDRLYLATNRGLFLARYPFESNGLPPDMERLHSGQIWGLDSIGRSLFVSADDGLFVLDITSPDSLLRVEGIDAGSWYTAPLKSSPGKILASTYNGFYILENRNGIWVSRNRIEGYDDAGGKFVEDQQGRIWLSHWIKGVYRLQLSPDLRKFSNIKLFTAADGLPSERDNSLSVYEGRILISTASGEFYSVSDDGKPVKDDSLSRRIPLKGAAHFYPVDKDISFAFSPNFVWKIRKDSNGYVEIDSVSMNMVANYLIPGFEHVSLIDKNNLILSNQEGFFTLNPTAPKTEKWKNGVFIETLAAGDSIIFSGLPKGTEPALRLPYSLNSLTFHFAAPEYRYENGIVYTCKLDNYDNEWTGPLEMASKEYTRLHEGEYTLHVRALNTVTGETSETSYTFTILPPWYRSPWAKAVYAVLILIAAFVIYRVLKAYSRKNAVKVRTQKEAEIAALKSERLEQEIKHKSSELSNTTMNVIKKNEILQDISTMLAKLGKKNSAESVQPEKLRKEVEKIQTLIHDNISHDDDWKKFTHNFDIVYSDFTKHLGELHPDLTISERRLCCYLKMGLSSKEIAPIFNITTKSVEMNRYRLRKKMGLEREVNLAEYLQGI